MTPEIPDAAVYALDEAIDEFLGPYPASVVKVVPGEKIFEAYRAGLAAALPLLAAQQTMLLQANEHHENYRAEQVAGLRALNAALLAVALKAKALHMCEDFEEMPQFCDKCRAEDMDAYQAVRLKLYEALAHPLVQQAMKASEQGSGGLI